MVQSTQCHRRCHGGVAELVDAPFQYETEPVVTFTLDQLLPHVGDDGQRRAAMKIDEAAFPIPRPDDLHRPETGDAAHLRVDHRLDKGRSNGRIHDIATAFESLETSLDRLRLWRGYHAICQRTTPCKPNHVYRRILSLESKQ